MHDDDDDVSFSETETRLLSDRLSGDDVFFTWRIKQALVEKNADWLLTLVAHWMHFHGLRVSDEARVLFLHILDKLNQTTEH